MIELYFSHMKLLNIVLVISVNVYIVKCSEDSFHSVTELNTNKFVLKNDSEIILPKPNKLIFKILNDTDKQINVSSMVTETEKSKFGLLNLNGTIPNKELTQLFVQGREKKKEDKFDKILKKLDKGRMMKFDGSLMVPALMGVLLKVATAIPVIMAISSVIGTISLIGSKVSLFISAILGIRTLIQYYNSLNPPTQEPPPMTQGDMVDIQNMIGKQNQMSDSIVVPSMSPPSIIPAMKLMPTSITSVTQAPSPHNAHVDLLHAHDTTLLPEKQHDESGHQVFYGYPDVGHYGVTNPEIPVDYKDYYYGAKETLYHPENYFIHNPSGAALDTYNTIHHNQLSLNNLQPHSALYYYGHDLQRSDKNLDKRYFVSKLKNMKKVVISDKDVIKNVKDLLKNSGNNKNFISKVKIVKKIHNS